MLKQKSLRQKPIADINVVPYIDVMLVLLVIFMITAPMLSQGVTVDLPKAASQDLKPSDREPIIVSVDRQGVFYLNINDNPAAPIEPQALLVRVAAELQLATQTNQKLNVLVKGDQGVEYGKVIAAMSMLKQAGAEQVGLLTDSTETVGENVA